MRTVTIVTIATIKILKIYTTIQNRKI
uniref:Uncharacterized protein n=1 Tax=Anguilla anguilla TaxID=7936 RepID=A0A0E9XXW4_ANGAN